MRVLYISASSASIFLFNRIKSFLIYGETVSNSISLFLLKASAKNLLAILSDPLCKPKATLLRSLARDSKIILLFIDGSKEIFGKFFKVFPNFSILNFIAGISLPWADIYH